MNVLSVFIILFVIISILFLILYLIPSYDKVIDVYDLNSLKSHFLLDNPNLNGSDPTGGKVNYAYCLSNTSNPSEEINDCKLITEYDIGNGKKGLKIDIDRNLDKNKKLGSVRLISKQAMKGGIFIFDVEHIPIGCGVWPAIWLNGFIGEADQIPVSNLDKKYKSYQSQSFKCKNGKPAPWPVGGEIDIIEQTNFSDTNLMSVHAGPNCEIGSVYNDSSMMFGPIKDTLNIRSCCGGNPCGKCGNVLNKYGRKECDCNTVNAAGNCQTKGPKGSFGRYFNLTKGGVYSVWWKNDELIYIYFWSNSQFTQKQLKHNGGPLSDNPKPKKWDKRQIVASYDLNVPETTGCKLNYQNIVINITLCGGWAGAVFPKYCSVDKNSSCNDWIEKCASTPLSNLNKDGTAKNGCFDGFGIRDGRPVFLQEAYFKIRSIRVFQTKEDMLLSSQIKESFYRYNYSSKALSKDFSDKRPYASIDSFDEEIQENYVPLGLDIDTYQNYNTNIPLRIGNRLELSHGILSSSAPSWKMIFSDNFASMKNWNHFTGADPTHSCVYYVNSSQVSFNASDGIHNFLRIQPKRNNTSSNPQGGFKSARIFSTSQFGPYGYFEAKIRLNNLSNMAWPAFWLTPQNVPGCGSNINCGEYGVWPRSGEIDVMETVNRVNKNYTTTHCGKDWKNDIAISSNTPVDFSKFNVFAVNWQPNVIDFYINAEMTAQGIKGIPMFSIPTSSLKPCANAIGKTGNAPFDKPMNLIFNVAIGGGFPLAMPNPKTNCSCILSSDGSCNLTVPWNSSCNCSGYNQNFSMDIAQVRVWERS